MEFILYNIQVLLLNIKWNIANLSMFSMLMQMKTQFMFSTAVHCNTHITLPSALQYTSCFAPKKARLLRQYLSTQYSNINNFLLLEKTDQFQRPSLRTCWPRLKYSLCSVLISTATVFLERYKNFDDWMLTGDSKLLDSFCWKLNDKWHVIKTVIDRS